MMHSPVNPRSQAQGLRQRLQARHWLRWHVLLIASLCLGGLALLGGLLRWVGIEALAWRYAAALPLAYLLYLGLLRLWASYLLSDSSSSSHEGPDLISELIPSGGNGSGQASGGFSSGGGGDFGGGGATGDFADAASELGQGALQLSGKALGAAADADEGAVVTVPLIAVLAIIGLLAALLGTVVFMLFGVEVLMAVAIEVALASTAGGMAYRAGRTGWLGRALSRTWQGAFITLLLGVALGLAIDHWLPAADSLPQALRMLLGKA